MIRFLFILIFSTLTAAASDIALITLSVGDNYSKSVAFGIASKEEYCSLHGYDFILCTECLDPSRPIAWSKIKLLEKVLDTNKYKWVFWSDADSIIMNFQCKLEELIDENYEFIVTEDLYNINSGQFFLKNSDWARNFLNVVYQHTEYIYHVWWEQQAIIAELENNGEIRKKTKVLPQRMMNSYVPEVLPFVGNKANTTYYQSGDFIVHFAGCHSLPQLNALMEKYSLKILR